MSISEKLRYFEFFEDFTNEELEQLTMFMDESNHEKEDIIINENKEATTVFFILKGRVKIFKMLSGASNFLTILEKNDIFGEVSFVDKKLRTASAVAIEDTHTASMNLEHFNVISKQNPQLGIKFIKSLMKELTRKFRAVNDGLDIKSSDYTIHELIESGQKIKVSTTFETEYIGKILYADKSQAIPMLKIDSNDQVILIPFNQVKAIILPSKYGHF
jgi:CRP-like cAMP-binding protein